MLAFNFVGDGLRYTYREMLDRCRRLAGGLAARGVEPGHVVSVLSPNTNVLLEAHFGVPYAGAVLNALNTRLSGAELAYIVGHAGARVLIVDEGRHSGGVSEAILAILHTECAAGAVVARRLTGLDTYIPLGPAANCVLPTEADVVREALAVVSQRDSAVSAK